jgi:hypothetical protein
MVGGYGVISAITVREGDRVRMSDNSAGGGSYYYSVRAFRNVNGVRIYSEHSEIVSITIR